MNTPAPSGHRPDGQLAAHQAYPPKSPRAVRSADAQPLALAGLL